MEEILSKIKNIYLIGIGGVGMSGLALILKDQGFLVKGSDQQDSSALKMLREDGIKAYLGHKKEQIDSSIDLVAYSSAISSDNLELIKAKEMNIPTIKRGELLGLVSKGQKTIAVAGSHGKTTTTSLLSYLLLSLNYSPAVFLGGTPLNYFRGAQWGKDYFVIETDESDGSFLHYTPWVSIITNIDKEHLEYYGNLKNLKDCFLKFARQTKGKVFGFGDQPYILKMLKEVSGVSFGWNDDNTIQGRNFNFDGEFSCFDLFIKGKKQILVKSPLLGKHNCLNVLAALSFFHYLGEDLNKVADKLVSFKGTKRRFQIKDRVSGVTFVDDYAHHPTEIKEVLSAARLTKPKRIFVVFQPHRFSRINLLQDDFYECFDLADEVVVTDIYSAFEDKIEGVSSDKLTRGISQNFSGKAHYIQSEALSKEIPILINEGDLVIGLGAGNINILMDKVVDEFKKNRTAV